MSPSISFCTVMCVLQAVNQLALLLRKQNRRHWSFVTSKISIIVSAHVNDCSAVLRLHAFNHR